VACANAPKIDIKEKRTMPKLLVSDRAGNETAVDSTSGLSVMEIIRDAGFSELQAMCNGSCSCATCHIYVDSDSYKALPEISEDENDLLETSENRRTNSRLACQIQFDEALDGLRVQIAPED
jgi:2Fe-2S ferredoxin